MEDKEKICNALEFIQAFGDGLTVEYKSNSPYDEWRAVSSFKGLMSVLLQIDEYRFRIKEKPSYRPYGSRDEFLADSARHGGWIILPDDENAYMPYRVANDVVYFYRGGSEHYGCSLSALCCCKWADDLTPCGKILEK